VIDTCPVQCLDVVLLLMIKAIVTITEMDSVLGDTQYSIHGMDVALLHSR
jgi:hypothetical protein